jgi:hypothetical protein
MSRLAPHEIHDPSGLVFARTARQYELSEDGLRFIFDALCYAPRLLEDYPATGDISGPQLCRAVARFAVELYGPEAGEVHGQRA